MAHNLNYQIHKIINSPYKIYINLLIFILIYLISYNNKIVFCMTEGTDVPIVAEASSQGQQRPGIQNEIQTYVSSQAELLDHIEQQSQLINNKNIIIAQQHDIIMQLDLSGDIVKKNLAEAHERLSSAAIHIDNLERDINYGGTLQNPEGYLSNIATLKARLSDSQAQLRFSETLLSNAKDTKDCLYNIIEKTINRTEK